VKIQYYLEEIPDFKIRKKRINEYLSRLIEEEGKKLGEITVIFCSDRYLLTINKEFLNRDHYTDVIAFDYCREDTLSGDLFISIERVRENAETYHAEFENELYRVLFHGVLHLAGYKDKSPDEIKEMRKKEDYYLNKLVKK